MDAVQTWNFFCLRIFGNGFIRCEHTFLNNHFGNSANFLCDFDGLSVLVQRNFHFGKFKINRSASSTNFFPQVKNLFKSVQIICTIGKFRSITVKKFIDLSVTQPPVNVNSSRKNFEVHNFSERIKLHFASHRQSVNIRVQTANTV